MPNDDLISRKALLDSFDVHKVTEYDEAGFAMSYNAVPVEVIEKAPTVDAEPVLKKPLIASIMETMNHMDENTEKGGHQSNTARREKWILFDKNHAKCSKCELKRNISTQVAWEYCPKCGEKMEFE